MRQFFVAILSGVAFGLVAIPGASAADLPRKAPPVVAPPPVVTWTQCYFGGNVGAGWMSKKWSSSYHDVPVPSAAALDSGYSHSDRGSDSGSGIVGGLQVGCDYQWNNWVWGIQGMFDWADISGSHTSSGYYDAKLSSRANWFGTVTGRVGYLVQPMTLLYFKGGAAWVQDQFSSQYSYFCETACNFSATVTRSGWTVGGGAEYKINPSWSVFVEYNYMDFGTANTKLSNSYGYWERYNISQDVQNVLFGVNWRWGGGGTTGAWGW